MVNQLFALPSTLEWLRQGPLSEHLDAYAVDVSRQGYAPGSIRGQIVVIAEFSRWLQQKRIPIANLNRGDVDRFLRRREQQEKIQHGDARALNRFVAMLSQMNLVKPNQQRPVKSAGQDVADEFRRHLLHERGLSAETVRNYVPFITQFLSERFRNKTLNLSSLRAADVTGFVRRQAVHLSPLRAKLLTTALRSFLGHLRNREQISTDLAACVPTVPNWSLSDLPKFLPACAVQQVLDHCDRQTPIGRRNYAILLLLARLGLRAGEVVRLNLADINWTDGLITVCGKGGRSAPMPLPVDVGEAIAMYLRKDRPECSSRRVFIRHRAPLIGFPRSAAISTLVMRALKRANVESVRKGAHLFRHSLATSLLKEGCSLDEIGELLRHQSPNTTAIYAKVDLAALRNLALPWPGGGR